MFAKRLFSIGTLLMLALLLCGCPVEDDFIYRRARWVVVNSTGETICFNGYDGSGERTLSYTLGSEPDDRSLLLYYKDSYNKPVPYEFEELYECLYIKYRVEITDENGNVLKDWRLSEKDSGGIQFYNEKAWVSDNDDERDIWIIYIGADTLE